MATDDAAANRLDAYVDDVVRGRFAAPAGIDPALTETVRRVHALGAVAAPRPDPSFVARLEATLMTETTSTPLPAPRPFAAANGHDRSFPPSAVASSWPDRSRWPLTQILVAAVLVLSVAVGIAANSINRAVPPPTDPGGTRLGALQPAVASPEGSARGSFAATIPPGWRVEQIAELFAAESGLEDGAAAFLRATREVDRGRYGVLASLPPGSSLEGYLLPGTYAFDRDDPARNVARMLDAFDRAFAPALRERAGQTQLGIHGVVTLASIVEREAVLAAERPLVADVYRKRWRQAADGWKLEADPTVQYAVGQPGAWWPELEADDLFVDSPYNTYQQAGLPPGPIANPSLASIEAVLFPETNPYFFFVASGAADGSHLFAATAEEQAANVERYRETIGQGGGVATPTRDANPRGACTLDPRATPIDNLNGRAGTPVGLPGTPTARLSLPSDVPPGPTGHPLGVPEHLLPGGEPASAEAIAGIRETLVQRAVCPQERGLAVFSDDYFRRVENLADSDAVATSSVLFPVPIRGIEGLQDMPLRDARVLPDGRVGAVVEERGIAGSEGVLGTFYVFDEQDGRWLIDEFVVIRRSAAEAPPGGSGPSPTPEASMPTPVAFAPTHQITDASAINLRPDPSFDHPLIVALPPRTPLLFLDEEVPARDGTSWMRFRTEDGREGWIRTIDVAPLGANPAAALPTPTVEAPVSEPTPTVAIAGADPILDPASDDDPSLDPTARTETVQTDADALLAGDPAARDRVRQRLRDALAKYGDDCRAGFVLVSGNGELGEGNALAVAVLKILRTDFPTIFGDVAGEVFAQPSAEPRGEVSLQIFFYRGCRPGAP